MLSYQRVIVVLVAALVWPASARAQVAPSVGEARRLYNAGHFEQALEMAEGLGGGADRAAARVVAGRAALEQYRQAGSAQWLVRGRELLVGIDLTTLDAPARSEWLIGVAEALYLEEHYGASAEVFAAALEPAALLGLVARERVFDWWATAVDRYAQLQPPSERAVIYERIADAVTAEISRDPASSGANYWGAVAWRGRGDPNRAWDAALAGWLRAALAADRGEGARGDLDRLMIEAVIPERARRLARQPAEYELAIASLTADWELFKQTWTAR